MIKSSGIYKITSPSNRVYIGQAVNIYARWRTYKSGHLKRQKRLYNSFLKYGSENHKFEVIEECPVENLNERERYWQEHYDVLSKKGLNCSLVGTKDKKLVHSEETKKILSSLSGENHPNYGKTFPKHINEKKGRKGELSFWYGKKLSKETIRKMQLKRSNKVKVIINGKEIIFECVRDCADYLGCTTKNILYRDKCRILEKKAIGRYKDIYIEILK